MRNTRHWTQRGLTDYDEIKEVERFGGHRVQVEEIEPAPEPPAELSPCIIEGYCTQCLVRPAVAHDWCEPCRDRFLMWMEE